MTVSDFIEQLLIAATIDAFFRLKCGRREYREEHPLMTSRYARLLERLEGEDARAVFDRAATVYGGAF